MMDMQDSEATHSSSESGVQSLKLFAGSLGVAMSVLLVSVVFSPHAIRNIKNKYIGNPLDKSKKINRNELANILRHGNIFPSIRIRSLD